MKFITKHVITLALLILFVSNAQAALDSKPDDLLGKWYNEEKTSLIEIYKCGNLYCGKIIWLKEPNRNGKPKLDDHNPDEKLQKNPLMGLNLLTGFRYEDKSVWSDGKIYDPKKGEVYSCNITMKTPSILEVRGYVGISLFGRTTTWTRADK